MTLNHKDAINIGKLMREGKTEEVRKILGWEKAVIVSLGTNDIKNLPEWERE